MPSVATVRRMGQESVTGLPPQDGPWDLPGDCRGLLRLLDKAGAVAVRREYARGETILREGEPDDAALYVLSEGVAELTKIYGRNKEVRWPSVSGATWRA